MVREQSSSLPALARAPKSCPSTTSSASSNAAGGQDIFDLDYLFDNLGVAAGSRAGRVSIVDKGASVEIKVDTDGDLNFDLHVATLKTADAITFGPDIFVGT